jgi:hypothetical protein
MVDVEKERVEQVNRRLAPVAFALAWKRFQDTPIDLVADSDDETCRCLHEAIVAYLEATGRIQVEAAYRDRVGSPSHPEVKP